MAPGSLEEVRAHKSCLCRTSVLVGWFRPRQRAPASQASRRPKFNCPGYPRLMAGAAGVAAAQESFSLGGFEPVDHPGFFAKAGPFTLAEVAQATGAELAAGADAGRKIDGVKALAEADASHLSFFENRKYLPQLRETRAGVCLDITPIRGPTARPQHPARHQEPLQGLCSGAGALLSGGAPAQGRRSRAGESRRSVGGARGRRSDRAGSRNRS